MPNSSILREEGTLSTQVGQGFSHFHSDVFKILLEPSMLLYNCNQSAGQKQTGDSEFQASIRGSLNSSPRESDSLCGYCLHMVNRHGVR